MAILRIIIVCAILAFGNRGTAQTPGAYELKAAFIVRFPEFVDWPAGTFATADTPLRICVFATDPLSRALEQAAHGERAGGRPLVTSRIEEVGQISQCQVAFLGAALQARFAAIFTALSGKAVLTVGDTTGFLDGGAIQLITDGNRIRFDVNLQVAQQNRLQISSKLLRLARTIRH